MFCYAVRLTYLYCNFWYSFYTIVHSFNNITKIYYMILNIFLYRILLIRTPGMKRRPKLHHTTYRIVVNDKLSSFSKRYTGNMWRSTADECRHLKEHNIYAKSFLFFIFLLPVRTIFSLGLTTICCTVYMHKTYTS